jgi:hypothetical protein
LIEFDFRNTLEGGRVDAIRKVGPQFCMLHHNNDAMGQQPT